MNAISKKLNALGYADFTLGCSGVTMDIPPCAICRTGCEAGCSSSCTTCGTGCQPGCASTGRFF